jgi:DNA-binding MarR family transcriptional regulator
VARTKPAGQVKPLTPEEEAAWRALSRAVVVIPRVMEKDLLEAQGLNLTEYAVLLHLSEAPDRSLRMGDLANYASITSGGLTRVVDRLSGQGLVERVRDESDGRGQTAVLTDAGFQRLESAWPTHLASVRRHVIDHLSDLDLAGFAKAMGAVGEKDLGPPARRSPQPSS